MADIVSPEVRSRMMSRIRSRDTKPELMVRRYLHGLGFRYRLSSRRLPGKPDLTLTKYSAAILVHGCFWHGHKGCRYATVPATRTEFWQSKFDANRERDRKAKSELLEQGWRVAIVWECALKLNPERTLERVEEFVVTGAREIELAG